MGWFSKTKAITKAVETFDKDVRYGHAIGRGSAFFEDWGIRSPRITREGEGTPTQIAMDLLKIKSWCFSTALIHGVPTPFSLDIARKEQIGADACASIKGGRRIFVSTSPYETADKSKIYDIYAGLTIHEAEHLISSHDAYKWLEDRVIDKHDDMDKKDRINIVEDVRIEGLAVERSEGFAGYLHSVREYAFGDQMIKRLAEGWEEMSPRSKVFSIVFASLRYPDALTDELKEFTSGGINPYKYMQEYDHVLVTFEDVMKLADYIHTLLSIFDFDEDEKDTREKMDKLGEKSEEMSEGISEALSEMFGEDGERSEEANEDGSAPEDKAPFTKEEMEKMKEEAKKDREVRELKEKLKKLLARKGRSAGEAEGAEGSRASGTDDLSDEMIEALKKAMAELEEALEKEFGYTEFAEAVEALSEIGEEGAMKSSVREKADSLEKEKFKRHEDWDWRGKREVATIEPSIERMEERRKLLEVAANPYILKLRRNLMLRLAEQERRTTDLRHGKIHRKKLPLAGQTDRIFCSTEKTQAVGVSICLLLDESGSMGQVSDEELRSMASGGRSRSAATMALLAAYTMQEALLGIPRTDLHIYSHASYGGLDEHCKIKRLYSPKLRKDRRGILGYTGGCQNYDHMAIVTTGEEFMKNAQHRSRAFIVLSDGRPYGHCYGGSRADKATKKAMEDLEKKGVYTLQIGFSGACPETTAVRGFKFETLAEMIPSIGDTLTELAIGAGRETLNQ
jgi:hypothetical protein